MACQADNECKPPVATRRHRIGRGGTVGRSGGQASGRAGGRVGGWAVNVIECKNESTPIWRSSPRIPHTQIVVDLMDQFRPVGMIGRQRIAVNLAGGNCDLGEKRWFRGSESSYNVLFLAVSSTSYGSSAPGNDPSFTFSGSRIQSPMAGIDSYSQPSQFMWSNANLPMPRSCQTSSTERT